MPVARDKTGRFKDVKWNLANDLRDYQIREHDDAILAVLMDLRDELKKLNLVFECHRFQRIPTVLDQIAANTTKRAYKKKDGQKDGQKESET